MKKSSFFLLSSALVLAIGVALLVRSILAPASKPAAAVEAKAPAKPVKPVVKEAVLVVSRDLQPGDFINGSDLRWKEVDSKPDRNLFFVRGQDERKTLYGATVRQSLEAGDMLAFNIVVRQGEPGFLAAVLRPGMRAVSIPTSRLESNFGLASPGDRVDVILGLRRDDSPHTSGDQLSIKPLLAAQTILRDVRVLALNNRPLSETHERTDGETAKQSASKKTKLPKFKTATLEVTPADAERLVVAKEVGTMQLALRSAREVEEGGSSLRSGSSNRDVTTLRATTNLYSSGVPVGVQTFRGDKYETISLPN